MLRPPLNTLNDFLLWAEQAFIQADLHFGHGTDNAWDEAVAIARYVLKLPPNVKASEAKRVLNEQEKVTLQQLTEQRIQQRLPVPYLTHQAYFAGLEFYVDERVLIPRSPIGELIQKQFKPWCQDPRKINRILDLCTGSGCIAIAAALAFPQAQVDASDLSTAALEVAKINIELYNLSSRVQLVESDLFQALSGQCYDIIISNPPYVPASSLKKLPPEYGWEPNLGLAAGKDGLDIVRKLLKEAPNFLNPGGLLIVEVGEAEDSLIEAYPNLPFTWLSFEQGGEGVFLLKRGEAECWQIF